MLYLEILYAILCKRTISIVAILVATICDILISLINKKWIKNIIYSLFTIIFIGYYMYFSMFECNLTISNIFNNVKAVKFTSVVIGKLSLKLLLFFIPLILVNINFKKIKISIKIKLIIVVLLYLISMIIILSDNKSLYSKYNLYFKIQNNDENVKEFGLITSLKLDLFKTIFKFKDHNIYNLNSICDNDEICEISEYLSSKDNHSNNAYTGIFKGKNLIVILAESFYPIGVSKETTPTLYEMINSGFNFTNYYTPLYPVSTADSQYVLDTSLLPANNTTSMKDSVNNYFIYSYPHVLNYKSFSYHNYEYNYYDRDKYMKNMGYQTYLACGNGLEKRIDCSRQSDYDMILSTVSDYIDLDNFLVYYTTMSGHANYDDTRYSIKKNKYLVEDLPYSEIVKNYMASQIELDKALEYLINALKEKNKLEDTVIVLAGDHPPYTLSESELKERKKINDYFDRYHTNLIIYNSEIKNTVVDKYCSTIDVLPTVLNLFGITYDNKLLMGKDIFSDDISTIVFQTGSFIYNGNKYNANYEKVTSGLLSKTEVEEIRDSIFKEYRYSRLILENDYYSKLK